MVWTRSLEENEIRRYSFLRFLQSLHYLCLFSRMAITNYADLFAVAATASSGVFTGARRVGSGETRLHAADVCKKAYFSALELSKFPL